ncbi:MULTISPECIES: conjugal transfer protein TraO [Dysgonomonas]|uniref:conjugal transfer protein TraO n=1 Tax=Dysgonomonas TaxID=156973 RepID=UPI000A027553|nr:MULTISPECIES: conjugal transfer protein TraO [Dysgonomonas]MBS7122619.1 conjugal transfer protein TraO [Dysgonomonas sp.]
MRKIIMLIVVLCFAFSGGAYAQRSLSGMRGIQLMGGMVDGIYSSKNDNEAGYYFGVAMATYTKNGNKWVFGAEYLERYYPYREKRLPIAQFTAEGGYYYNFLTDPSKTVFLSLGGSALAGYETSNWGEKTLYDGSTLQHKDAFIYGGAITLEIETYLTDHVVLLVTGRERILWGYSTGHFHGQFGVGIKFIIN